MSEAAERHLRLAGLVSRLGWTFFGAGAAAFLASWAGYETLAKSLMALCIFAVCALIGVQWRERKAFIATRLEQGASRDEAINEWAKAHEPT